LALLRLARSPYAHLTRAPAFRLCAIKGGIGVCDETDGFVSVIGEYGDPDAQTDAKPMAFDFNIIGYGRKQTLGQGFCGRGLRAFRKDERKLVAAEPRQECAVSGCGQAPGYSTQEGITDGNVRICH
jgi:hypothetical protein